ncbi:adenine nucleotide alpha hydrolases-like protein [Backusella circina FSU 941]|nr:adenine nucleotide alpha hydrolases-like protein [Backusella circina FSU 941]
MEKGSIVHENIFPETQHKDLTRIVAISIDEGSAEYVYDWATKNFIDPKRDMVSLLNCRTVIEPMAPYISPKGFHEEVDDTKKIKSHALLQSYAHRLTEQGIAVRAIALLGEPKHEVLKKVAELKADVLIMGTRQLGTIKRALMGSTSDYLSHHSSCTTIVVRAHHEDPEGKHPIKSIYKRHEE